MPSLNMPLPGGQGLPHRRGTDDFAALYCGPSGLKKLNVYLRDKVLEIGADRATRAWYTLELGANLYTIEYNWALF